MFLADFRRGYSREGEIVAKILDLDEFEIEAEIPVGYLQLLEKLKKVEGRGLDGQTIDCPCALRYQSKIPAPPPVLFAFIQIVDCRL